MMFLALVLAAWAVLASLAAHHYRHGRNAWRSAAGRWRSRARAMGALAAALGVAAWWIHWKKRP